MFPSIILILNMILPFQYETYLESSKKDPITILQNFNIQENVIITVAYSDFKFPEVDEKITLSGLEFSPADFKKVVDFVHSKKGVVKLSLGGFRHHLAPLMDNFDDASALAKKIAKIIHEYNLDGVDLSIEDKVDPNYETVLIKLLRDHMPSKIISLTLLRKLRNESSCIIEDVKGEINYFNLMENKLLSDSSQDYLKTLQDDIVSYADKWKIHPKQIQIGIYQLKDRHLNLNDVRKLSSWVKENGYLGISTWNLNQDAEEKPPFSFSNAIMQILFK